MCGVCGNVCTVEYVFVGVEEGIMWGNMDVCGWWRGNYVGEYGRVYGLGRGHYVGNMDVCMGGGEGIIWGIWMCGWVGERGLFEGIWMCVWGPFMSIESIEEIILLRTTMQKWEVPHIFGWS